MGKIATLEPSWREWVVTNLRRCCSQESIVGSMVEKDFDAAFARAAVAGLAAEIQSGTVVGAAEVLIAGVGHSIDRNGRTDFARAPESHASERQDYVFEPSRLPVANVIGTSDRAVLVLMRLKKPEVLVLGNLLSDDECNELIRRSEVKLARSTTIDPQTGKEIVVQNRSSSWDVLSSQ